MMNAMRLDYGQRWRRKAEQRWRSWHSKTAVWSLWRHVIMDCRGFALLEIMIAMIVAGLLIGPGVKMWRLQRQQSAYRTTIAHQQTIFQALADYWTLHGCLPWPSRLGGDRQGISERPAAAASFYRGIVPYGTLGLSNTIARDGWGQWMVYWVDGVMTTPGMMYHDTWCRTCFGQPSVLDVIHGGGSVQEGLKNSPQNHRPMATGSAINRRPRMDGVAVILLGDPDTPLFSQASSPDMASHTSALNDPGPIISVHGQTPLPSSRRVVQWKTRSHLFSVIGVRCIDSFFAQSPPTIEEAPKTTHSSAQSTSATSGKIIMRPIPTSP